MIEAEAISVTIREIESVDPVHQRDSGLEIDGCVREISIHAVVYHNAICLVLDVVAHYIHLQIANMRSPGKKSNAARRVIISLYTKLRQNSKYT